MKPEDLNILLSINEAIATTRDTMVLFRIIFSKLSAIFPFHLAGFELLNKDRTHLEIYLKGVASIPKDNSNKKKRTHTDEEEYYLDIDGALDIHKKVLIEKAPIKISTTDSQISRLTITDLKNENNYPNFKILNDLFEKNKIAEVIHCPLQTGGKIIGFLILAFEKENQINSEEMAFLQQIANQVAILISVTIAYSEIYQRECIKDVQLELTNSLVTIKDRDQLFRKFVQEIDKLMSIKYLGINVKNLVSNESITVCFTKGQNGKFKTFPLSRNMDIPFLTLKSHIRTDSENNYYEFEDDNFSLLCQQSSHFRFLKEKFNISSILFINYNQSEDEEINIILSRDIVEELDYITKLRNNGVFVELEVDFFIKLLPQISMILKNFFAYEEINHLKKQIEQEKNYLLDEINLENNFQEIVGNSFEIHSVLNKVKQVAPLDVTVLIQGETGTGKELIARALHDLSGRKDRTLVKVNCTALPAQLIESELFGHEKGSFTGAIERRIGKFELANGGTIFLDEIGELPLELQAKLLRVLQELEFERIGGKQTIKTDVRVISATNRNLEKEVEKGNFRADLFFRLNVFPIEVPPLRKRIEDIPLFVKFFLEKYSKKNGKQVKFVKKADLDALMQYDWPGNIRELEHIIERAVIISKSQNLELPNVMTNKTVSANSSIAPFKKLQELEREHIISALKAANGKVTGENGAASLLGINGKTLGSKMRKLGIKKEIVIT
jgi:formate hydrogenlyase transcriptional activator